MEQEKGYVRVVGVKYFGSIISRPSSYFMWGKFHGNVEDKPHEIWGTNLACGHAGQGYGTRAEAEAHLGKIVLCGTCRWSGGAPSE